MWFNFLCAYALIILMLFTPGYFFFRAIGFSRLDSTLSAPLFSIAAVCIIGLIFNNIGIFSSALSVGIAVLLIPLTLFLCRRHHRKNQKEPKTAWCILGLYILAGLAVGVYVYILPLNGPESIIQTYDNVFHYNVIESFAESGSWSILNVDEYLSDQAIDPFPGTSFYPAAWHIVSAFAANALQVSAPLAANATNFVFCTTVFPVSIFALLRSLFPGKHVLIASGFIACCLQTTFPWALYAEWPLLPNGASFCLCMTVASLFIVAVNKALSHESFLPYATGFLFGLISLASLQPNSIFTLMVFLMPFLLWQIARCGNRLDGAPKAKALRNCLVFLVLFAILLFIFFRLPFLQATISYYWAPLYGPIECLKAIGTWSLSSKTPQPHIIVLALCGSGFLVAKNKTNSWLVASLLSGILIFFIVAGTPESTAKHFFGGYWYNDPYRIAAFCSLFSIPITAVGIYGVSSLLGSFFKQKEIASACCSAGCSVVLAAVTFMPCLPTSEGFANLRNSAYAQNSADWNYLDEDETEFIKKVKSIVPEGALIINQPFDGSMYAYGKTGIDLYFRSNTTYNNAEGETADSRLIRHDLKSIASNTQVKEAVSKIGASYVLLLKPDFKEIGMYYPAYDQNEWSGIDNINNHTPGFHIVLEESNMKLYKIDG